MKKFFCAIGCIVCALCLTALGGCDLFEPSTGDNTGNSGSQTGSTVAKTGDTVTNSDGVLICLVSVEDTALLGTEYLGETTENNFILLTVKVTNNSKKQQTFYGSCADLYNSGNVKYEAKTSMYIDFIISEDVGVGVSKTFQIVFETPTTTKQEKYTVKIGYSSYTLNSKRVTFELT